MTNSMTNRDFLNAVINSAVSDEIREYAKAQLEKLNARNAARAAKPSKAAIANEPIKQAIVQILSATPMTTTDIAKSIGVSTQKASAILLELVKDGVATACDVKIPKVGTRKAYTLTVADGANGQ